MLKHDMKFKDFDGNEREAVLYFNLTEAELVDWQADSPLGIQEEMMDAVRNKDMRRLLDFVKTLIEKSYGERDGDGIHFNKSDEIRQRFINSAMYSPLLLSLFQEDGAKAITFINGLMPADLVKRAMEQGDIPMPTETPTVPETKPSAREVFEQRAAERSADLQAPIVPTTPAPTMDRSAVDDAEYLEWRKAREAERQ